MKKILGIFSLIMVITALSGCSNTFHGAGEDIETMGEWIQDRT